MDGLDEFTIQLIPLALSLNRKLVEISMIISNALTKLKVWICDGIFVATCLALALQHK
jgi:hypothetical protein